MEDDKLTAERVKVITDAASKASREKALWRLVLFLAIHTIWAIAAMFIASVIWGQP